MSIDELKALLDAGTITKEQFEAMAKALDPNYTTEPEQPPQNDDDQTEKAAPELDIEKMIQRAVDRATNKLGNDNKKLREQLESLRKAKLTAEEQAELDRKQQADELAEERRAFQDEKNRWYAIRAIKKAGLDDGSDNSLELVDFVIGADEADIDAKVKAFGGLVKKFVKAEVDKTFRTNGRNPEQGTGAGDKNPWTKEAYNITQQMQLELTNPELAKQMKAAAGIK